MAERCFLEAVPLLVVVASGALLVATLLAVLVVAALLVVAVVTSLALLIAALVVVATGALLVASLLAVLVVASLALLVAPLVVIAWLITLTGLVALAWLITAGMLGGRCGCCVSSCRISGCCCCAGLADGFRRFRPLLGIALLIAPLLAVLVISALALLVAPMVISPWTESSWALLVTALTWLISALARLVALRAVRTVVLLIPLALTVGSGRAVFTGGERLILVIVFGAVGIAVIQPHGLPDSRTFRFFSFVSFHDCK